MTGHGLKNFAKKNGLDSDSKTIYGQMGGYWVSADEGSGYKRFMVSVFVKEADEKYKAIAAYLERYRADKKNRLRLYRINRTHIEIVFFDNPGTMKRIEKFVPDFLAFLSRENIPGAKACPLCGNDIGQKPQQMARINGAVINAHADCLGDYENSVQKNREDKLEKYEQSEKSVGRGALGAVLGGIAGSIPLVLVYLLGYVAAATSMFIALAAEYGYKLLGGKPSKALVWIIALVVIVMVPLAYLCAVSINTYKEVASYGYSLWEMPGLIISTAKYDSQVQSALLKDFIQVAVYGLLGFGVSVWMLRMNTKAQIEGEKIRIERM